jgi:non-heme chloroperoxidase
MDCLPVCIFALMAVSNTALLAGDIEGDWQGTLKVEDGLRLVLRITKGDSGALAATFYSIDQSHDEIPVSSISLDGSTLIFSIDLVRAKYEGVVAQDGNSIAGRWFGPRTPGSFLPLDFRRATKETAWPIDASPHTVQFISVDKDVKLEVLDWGGTGRPLVLLAGLGSNAHVFDQFAPKLTGSYHVYGITRRGFGHSSTPEPTLDNYSADRLGDDVLAVIESLKLERPILVGHSIAGEELSSIGSRHPEKVSALVYLDAAFPFAYYDSSQGDLLVDSNDVRRKLLLLIPLFDQKDSKPLIRELLKTDIPRLVKDLEKQKKELDGLSDEALQNMVPFNLPYLKFAHAIMAGERKYSGVKIPTLAFFAVPPEPDPAKKADPMAKADARFRAWAVAQARAFEVGNPNAHVVRLKDADHFVFKANEAEVLRDMNEFLSRLP